MPENEIGPHRRLPGRSAPFQEPLRLLQILGGAEAATSITGVERVVQTLIQSLDPDRYEHYLGYPETGPLLQQVRDRVRAVLGDQPQRRLDRDWMAKLSSFVQTHRIDLLVTHGWRADFLTALACRRLRKPQVISRAAPLVDEATMGAVRKALYSFVDTWSLHACDAIVTVAEASKERMCRTQHLPARRVTVIPNGVRVPPVSAAARQEARLSLGAAPGDLVIGSAGRLVRGKGFDVLVDAVAELQRHSPQLPAQVVILGEGPERQQLENRAARQGLKLHLPGFLGNPYPSMAAFDVAVLPSRSEGMPLVVLESMALGVPTVATAVGGCREIVADGETGFLVPVGDSAALADRLERLLVDPALRRRLGEAAARRVQSRHSVEAMVQRFDVFLTQTASRCYQRSGRGRSGAFFRRP